MDLLKKEIEEKFYEKPTIYCYESIIIVKFETNIDAIISEYEKFFESIANNIEIENLGIRKLAYEIGGVTEGNYVIFQYEANMDDIKDIEKKFRLDDNIIKFITVRNEPVFEEKVEDKNTLKFQRGNAYSYEDGLKQRVQEKLTNEYNDFVNELKKERTQVIIERAYEKVCKEEILYVLEKKDLSTNECKALLKCSNILDDCYDEWLKSDGNFNEMLECAVDNSIQHIVDDFYKEKKQKSRDVR